MLLFTHTIINSEPGALSHTDLPFFLAKNTLECVVHDMTHKSITRSTQLLSSVIRFLGSSDMIWNTDTCSRLILLQNKHSTKSWEEEPQTFGPGRLRPPACQM